ncbi:CSPG5 protein, partial [Amia calva]|nr:CSPG5 protein [Amia calva]
MDENDPRLTSSPPTSMLTPEEVLVLLSGTQDEEPPPLAPGTAEFSNETECRPGYIRHNASCRSHCDFFPSYCFNGGQCYLVEGTGVFCRCNVQDYIWHKGSRCESVVTEFQVLCLAVGAAALMVLLLFMITVFFAKKLHLLKTENSKLRKRSSKYRPPSEQHNDNFSLSTIAEGSHPNKTMSRYTWECKTKEEPDCQDDPNAQNKLEDPVKAPPPKDEEPLNIQNSLTPKHENNKASSDDSAEAGVTIDVELHIPKHATVLPPASPPMRYNVYLYKVPRSPGPRRGYDPQSTQSLPPLPSKRPHSRLDKACTP